jgi:UDP-N-acetylmuramoyl-tripeptide--D-alanyl-D-alanine ligase
MCSLTPPNAALVTAVGEMHLERFGSAENVFQAKSELPQALPNNGLLVLNGDYEYCRKMAANTAAERIFFYGLDEDLGHLDAFMYNIKPGDKGTAFTIRWLGQEYAGFTQLLGRPMLSNVLGCFTMACAVGLNPELVIAVLRNVKAESNRLEPARSPISSMLAKVNGKPPKQGTVLRLNDAYNSNPKGFAGALEVLETVAGKRKILVTPGMIELGERQFDENKAAAHKASSICDLVIVVGKTNEKALLDGLNEGGMAQEKFKTMDSMADALSYLAVDYCEDGDVVLIENDLPDLYESTPKF